MSKATEKDLFDKLELLIKTAEANKARMEFLENGLSEIAIYGDGDCRDWAQNIINDALIVPS